VTIGRDQENDIVVDDKLVSRRHAQLVLRATQWVLEDLKSRNGTRVNDQFIYRYPMVNGDRIRVGTTELVYAADADPLETHVAASSEVRLEDLLTEREREIVALVGKGHSDADIAEKLYISVSTVRSHLDRIGEKTGLRKRPELTRLAVEHRLI
jgi:pSer/pThr/pTyr-binding forkhead associated (FHA) protein